MGANCHFSSFSFLTTTVHKASYIFISVGAKHIGISRVDLGPTLMEVFFFNKRQNWESSLLFSTSSGDGIELSENGKLYKHEFRGQLYIVCCRKT